MVGESQDGEDVTQQSADLDTRLENARVSEKRLRDILAQRTGKLSDVLDVEREIARVRGEIEGMEAERRSLDRRVTYATVSVTLTEDRKSEVNLGPVPVSRRLRNALVEGWTNAINSGVDVLLFIAGVGPTLVLWAMILVPAAVLVRRRLSKRLASHPIAVVAPRPLRSAPLSHLLSHPLPHPPLHDRIGCPERR